MQSLCLSTHRSRRFLLPITPLLFNSSSLRILYAFRNKSTKATTTPQESSCTTASTTTSTTTTTTTTTTTPKTSWFNHVLETYSPHREAKQILLAEHLFRAAQDQAYTLDWYSPGVIPFTFRARHAMLTMHIWFLHKRLILDPSSRPPTFSLRVQEELFDALWNDTKARIRAEKIHEMTVYSHLRQVQQYTMLHMTHYDHAFSLQDPKDRLEECMKAVYIHVWNQNPKVSNALLHRLGVYLMYQMENIVYLLPDEYFFQGRIGWGNLPNGLRVKEKEEEEDETVWSSRKEEEEYKATYDLPKHWKRVWTDAGEYYYWNTETHGTQWNRPHVS